ncbi:hypothetical protein C8Q73DRAFT_789620 [Cubamyces lactineus]|nr:hypothetical protein C8Q73DRAFT_789620 [Cubamyces lactineus]
MAQIPLLKAALLAIFIEAILFGIHTILYFISVWVLLYRRRRWSARLNLWMFTVATAMWALACVYLGLDIPHVTETFVDHSSDPGGPLAYYEHEAKVPYYMVSPVLFEALTLLGDCFMTYRVYVVWKCKLASLVLPILLIIGGVVAAGVTGYAIYTSPQSVPSSFMTPAVSRPMVAYFVMTLATNIITTFLLLARIMYYDREARRTFQSQDRSNSVHWRVMKTIIQCEAIYSLGILLLLVLFVVGSNAVFIMWSALPPLVGISFTMIIARIGLSEVLDDGKNRRASSSDLSTLRAQVPGAHDQACLGAGQSRGPIQARVFVPPAVAWEDDDADDRMDGSDAQGKTVNAALREERVFYLHPLQRPQSVHEV